MLGKPQKVIVGQRVVVQAQRELLVVPDFEVVDVPEDAHIAYNRGALAQERGDHNTSLSIDFRHLPVVVHPVEKLEAYRMIGPPLMLSYASPARRALRRLGHMISGQAAKFEERRRRWKSLAAFTKERDGEFEFDARDGRRFTARTVIAADGVYSVVARRLGLNPGWPAHALALAVGQPVWAQVKTVALME